MSARIDTNILNVLAASTVDGNVLVLTSDLDRNTYVQTDKVLKGLGGKWCRKSKGHIFPFDPTDALENALQTGVFENRKQSYQSFYTPREVAETLVRRAKLDRPALAILEPNIGTGQLATVVREHLTDGSFLVGIDIDPVALDAARASGFSVREQDFLTLNDETFDRIIANPPFTRGQDIDHVRHMYELLEPGGRLVSVMSGRITWATDRKTEEFRAFVNSVGGEIHGLPAESFKESGTPVSTVYVVLDRKRT